VGPDLTHFASRATIGAGVAPNTPDTVRRWVLDAGSIKPGVLMPPFAFSENDLDAMVAYLGSLQ
jgi:cytochrome c oxidase subunit II